MTHASIDELPHLAGDATSLQEFIDVARRSPLATSDRGFEVLGYAAGQAVLNGKEKYSKSQWSKQRLDLLEIQGQAREDWELILPNTEGELRTNLRVMFASMMRPGLIRKFEDAVSSIVTAVFDEIAGEQDVEMMSEVFWKIPSRMYCDLVAAPYDFAPRAAELADSGLAPLFTQDISRRQELLDALYDTYDIVDKHIAARRENLGDDFASIMIRQQMEGKLTERELVFNAVGMVFASIDNTAHQMGMILGMLLDRPDVWARLVEDKSLIPAATEEAMRLLPRFNIIARQALTDDVLEGHDIPAGSWMFVSIPTAHRDEAVLDDPEEFRLDRPVFRPLSFGGGVNNCLGQHLARLEINRTITEFVSRYPRARLIEGWNVTVHPHVNEVRELKLALA